MTVVGLFISEINTNKVNTSNPAQYIEVFSTVPGYTIPSNVYLVGINGNATGVQGWCPTCSRWAVCKPVWDSGRRQLWAAILSCWRRQITMGAQVTLTPSTVSRILTPVRVQASVVEARLGYPARFPMGMWVELEQARWARICLQTLLWHRKAICLSSSPRDQLRQPRRLTSIPATRAHQAKPPPMRHLERADSVGILDAVSTSRSYAAITFKPAAGTGSTIAGSTVVTTSTWVAVYLGRISNLTTITSGKAGLPATGIVAWPIDR